MKKQSALIRSFCLLLAVSPFQQQKDFLPGEQWNDMQGNPINAHHGCVIGSSGTYFWYGEKINRRSGTVQWEGISCYTSKDLLHWKNNGLIFAATAISAFRAECPRIVYNSRTGKFVMWLRMTDTSGRPVGFGILTSDRPDQSFKLIQIDSATTHNPTEIAFFRDNDERAYVFYTASDSSVHAVQLTNDYLHVTKEDVQILPEKDRSGPVPFKHHGKYYLLTSSSQPYTNSKTTYAVADKIMGPWKTIGSPFMGPGYASGYQSRASFALPLKKIDVSFLYLADRWNQQFPECSTYVWLPMGVDEEGDLEVPWQKSWHFFK